ncbi:protein kinase [Boothiomyces sp. JEL0866]|nr:protein kinase [Boothiomyces sp. JEL0866]
MVEYDMDELEKEKENVQATKYGYKPDVVGKDYEHMRRIKEAELKKVNKDDPLLPYVEYIIWTTKHFTFTHPSISSVRETAVRQFRKDPRFDLPDNIRYKNDSRYVDLWMDVVRKQPDAGEAFKYLAVNQIGTGLAIYYLEYARYYESGNDYDRADELYRLGISRKAHPVDEIVKEYNKFLARKAQGIPLEEKPQPKKKALQPKTTAKDKLKVYRDSSEPDEVLVPEASAGWKDYSIKPKENKVDPEKWVGTTYKQDTVAPSNPKLNVYKDEHEEVVPRKKPKIFKPKPPKDDLLAEHTSTADMNGNVLVTKMELLRIKNKEFCFEENRAISYGYDINPKSTTVPEKPKFKPASPTINTKDAMRDIMDIFNAPIQGDTEVDQVIYYNPQDDETISSKVYKRNTEELKLGVFKDEDSDDDSDTNPVKSLFSEGTPKTVKNVFGQPVQIMTPVTEKSEITFHHTSSFEAITEEQEPIHPSDPHIRAAIMKRAYNPQNKSFNFSPTIESPLQRNGSLLIFNGLQYKIIKTLTENEYSKVYVVQSKVTTVMKISTPSSGWEYYILHQIHSKSLPEFIVKPLNFHFFKNESILELNYEPGLTLLDVFNSCRNLKIGKVSPGIDELLVLHYSIRLLDISIYLFSNGFIHGDLRLENYITKNQDLVLVDFGAAIDLNHFKPTQMMQIPKSDQQPHEECWECRNGMPFKYEPDLYNLACMIHILLFGKLLETNPQSAKKEKIKVIGKFEKDWNIELWNNLFMYLLNSNDWSELNEYQMAMKQYLLQHERNTELDGYLQELEFISSN